MLNEYTGYLIGVLATVIILPMYIKKTKAKEYIWGRSIFVLLLIIFSTIHIASVIFPMPIQQSVIQSGFREKENYIMPFSELITLYEYNVIKGEITAETFIREYLISIWDLSLKIMPIGLFTEIIFKLNFKKYIQFSLVSLFAFELVKLFCNIITTVNYISFVTEHLLYAFLSLLLGFLVYLLILKVAKKLRNKSNIMLGIYHMLKQ